MAVLNPKVVRKAIAEIKPARVVAHVRDRLVVRAAQQPIGLAAGTFGADAVGEQPLRKCCVKAALVLVNSFRAWQMNLVAKLDCDREIVLDAIVDPCVVGRSLPPHFPNVKRESHPQE